MIEMTHEDYLYASEDGIGYCLACGFEQDCCEPDARNYTCEDCGCDQVFGVEELMMMNEICFVEGNE